VKDGASNNWSHALRSVSSVNESQMNESRMKTLCFTPNLGCCNAEDDSHACRCSPFTLLKADTAKEKCCMQAALAIARLHCAKSYRPFELFVNVNCEL